MFKKKLLLLSSLAPFSIIPAVSCSAERTYSENKLTLPLTPPTQFQSSWDGFSHPEVPVLQNITLQDLLIWWISLDNNYSVDNILLQLAQKKSSQNLFPFAQNIFDIKTRVNSALFGVANLSTTSSITSLNDYIYIPTSSSFPESATENALQIFAPNSKLDSPINYTPINLYNDSLKDLLNNFETKSNPPFAENNYVGVRITLKLQSPNTFVINNKQTGQTLDLMFKIPVSKRFFSNKYDLVTTISSQIPNEDAINFDEENNILNFSNSTYQDTFDQDTSKISDFIDLINEATANNNQAQLNKYFVSFFKKIFNIETDHLLDSNFSSNFINYYEIIFALPQEEGVNEVNLFDSSKNSLIQRFITTQTQDFQINFKIKTKSAPVGQPSNGWNIDYDTTSNTISSIKYFTPPVFKYQNYWIKEVDYIWDCQMSQHKPTPL